MNPSALPIINSTVLSKKKDNSNGVDRRSTNFHKMYKPINWTSANFKKRLSNLKTPSGLERVVDWMDTNIQEPLEKNIEDKNDTSVATFYRYDYKIDEADMKKCDESNYPIPLNHINESKIVTNEPYSKPSVSPKNVDRLCDPITKFHQSRNGNLHFSPSSAERKKELCNYLKLMNHADKKEVCMSLYRRSTRVKILEQKELAKKMQIRNSKNESDEKSEKSVKSLIGELSSIGESLTLQSFNDLNMTIDTSKYPILQEIETPKTFFNFIMPPSAVLNEFNDFHKWVEPILKQKNLKKQRKKNGALNKIKEKTSSKAKTKSKNEENSPSNQKNSDHTSSPTKKRNNLETNTINVINEENMENTVTKIKINEKNDLMSIDKESLNKDNSISSIRSETKDAQEIVKNGNINIRIDYDDGKSKNLNSETKNVGFCKRVCLQNNDVFHGFSESEIRKSKQRDAKFKAFVSQFLSIPKSVLLERIKLKHNLSGDIPEPPDKILDDPDEEMEEIQSESDSSSDSLSTLESENSSSSCCASLPDNENVNISPVQKCDTVSPTEIPQRTEQIVPFNDKVEINTLHSHLKKQLKKVPCLSTMNSSQDWDSDNSFCGKQKTEINKNNSHFVSFEKENGRVQFAVYVDFYLILIQEYAVSLWNQTALGNVLGAHNLWIFNGFTKKLILNKECIQKKSLEMVTSTETCVVYIELWTKEHKSDIRQGPVADIFAIVYFWIQKLNKMDKKVLQLENINGFADDVQYVVLKPSLNIVVSWHSIVDDNKVTQIHVYTLAPDFQTIINIRAMAKVEHYVSSLHNIEDCEELLMGCGEDRITLWNIEHGYIVASIKLSDIKLSLSTLWVKCDRGILFTVQQCVDRELRLIAINGRSLSWKRLKSYKPPEGYERIQNVYIENGVLISFYEEGILCWKAQSGEKIVEEIHNETDTEYFPSGKYLIITTEKNVFVGHALTHLLTIDD